MRRTVHLSVSLIACAAAASACPQGTGWQRSGDPVLRVPIPDENYEVAGDPHVFLTQAGTLAMIFSGDEGGTISIRLATGRDWGAWATGPTLLGPDDGPAAAQSKETAFYRLSDSGQHQIYFIGYSDPEVYDSQVFRATAPSLTGPWTVDDGPVVPRGDIGGRDVALITSPSVVSHEGLLYMAFLAWNGFEDVTEVWVMGATSSDDGTTWTDIREVPVPIGMEGQITPMPGGGYVAVRTGEGPGGREGITIACAEHPFGPYLAQTDTALTLGGPPWEVDEIIAPQITFDPETGEAHLYYTGADYARGWWVMAARQAP